MLATLDDLVAIGALQVGYTDEDAKAVRATRLLELASAQAVAYLRVDDEDAIADISGWTDAKSTALAAIIAEAAGSRLNVSAAPSSDPYASVEGLTSALLNRRHYAAIDRLIADNGSFSMTVVRDEDSSFLRPYDLASSFEIE